ncbi:SRSF protein kinase 3-like isoform X2 [Plectropomus leopardus]|uniref:SRSF protein kinase 3-like isoform X2 n=1 Tax=Plectropomus leopardus TaxID=160734 RepID=UPI001C4AF023|nr:SRSF protein kinase 3-like isoform X2 [Plectropomus leopardus]
MPALTAVNLRLLTQIRWLHSVKCCQKQQQQSAIPGPEYLLHRTESETAHGLTVLVPASFYFPRFTYENWIYHTQGFLPECCCHLGPSSAVLQLFRLWSNMSSSYAAAISALLSTSSSNPPVTASPHPSPDAAGSPEPDPTPSKPAHCPPAAQTHPQSPAPVGSYDEQQENPADYGIGGYYPVEIGEIFVDRYQVVKKLGWGHFSTVWLCWDMVKGRFVALKVVKSAQTFTETALDEIKLLKCVRDSDPKDPKRETIVHLIDDFRITAVNGEHVCMVLEVLGHQLLRWIIKSNYTGLPLPCVKSILRQVLQGLDYLHTKCKIIHTDIKPENILLRVDEVYIQNLAANTKLWQLPVSSAFTSSTVNRSSREKQSSKVSGSPIKRLTRKDRSRRGKESSSDHNRKDKLHVSFSDVTAPTSTRSSTCLSKLTGPHLTLRRQTMLLEDGLDLSPHSRKDFICSCPDLNSDASVSGSRSLLLHQTADKELPPPSPSSPRVISDSDVLLDLLKPQNADKILIKIADLGNACWVHKHFTEDIQTCQYRSVEVLIGADYDTPADIWSTACMAFELATGDYLFDPQSGATFSREEDHIAHIIELLGSIPCQFALSGRNSKRYFNRKGQLRRITKLKPWSLFEILLDKYEWPHDEADNFSSFLLTMLELLPQKRATAAQCLKHPWIAS